MVAGSDQTVEAALSDSILTEVTDELMFSKILHVIVGASKMSGKLLGEANCREFVKMFDQRRYGR